MKKVVNKIVDTKLLAWKSLEWFQPVDFKLHRKENIEKLKKSLINNGFSQPFTVWKKDDKLLILDGHYRKMAFDQLDAEGISIPELLPCNLIDCKNEKEAKKVVLIYNSHYARINKDEIFNFTNGMDLKELSFEIELPNIDFASMIDELGKPLDLGDIAETSFQYEQRLAIEQEANRIAKEKVELEREKIKEEIRKEVIQEIEKGNIQESEIDDSNKYTKKIESPIYEPSNEKPAIENLYDLSKYKILIEEIEKSNISEHEKEFLRLASTRHIIFSYDKIADYYSHSNNELKNLMENNALVIIDFNKAIELGFVKISDEIAKMYKEDYHNDSE
jgi:hypothetical protein